jgi:glycosyltransferase involved in cell wall biosynthesis
MEALACGLPCLVSDIPANKEWVREGYNGWLFRDNDHKNWPKKFSRPSKCAKTARNRPKRPRHRRRESGLAEKRRNPVADLPRHRRH